MVENYWKEKTVVITGGSSGLGFQLGKEFLRQGAHVCLVARDADRLEEAMAQLDHPRTQAIPSDVTKDASLEQLFSSISDRPIHAWVNAVGKSDRGKVLETTPQEFRELFEVNFLSVVRCSRLAVPKLLETKGHLINIGSLASKSASRFLGAYPATKFPVAAYSQQMRLELGPLGLHVLLVCPGPLARDDAGRRYEHLAKDLPPHAVEPGGGVKVRAILPERLARAVLAACQRRKPELVVPAKARILFALAQLSPSLGDWIVRNRT